MKEIRDRLRQFRDERDWRQFHTPENLAKSIVIEAGELLEHFQWDSTYDHDEVVKELADVANYCFLLADALNVDLSAVMLQKIDENELKYPVDKAKGKSDKYTKL